MEFNKPDDNSSVSKPSQSFLMWNSSTTIMSSTRIRECRNSNHNNSCINLNNSNLRSNNSTRPSPYILSKRRLKQHLLDLFCYLF